MKKFIIIMYNKVRFEYFIVMASDDTADDKIIKKCKDLHTDIFGEEKVKELQEGNYELLAIFDMDIFIKMPVVSLYYPDESNETIQRALNIFLDAAGL